jgi:very-short-patch-repair endonuclease
MHSRRRLSVWHDNLPRMTHDWPFLRTEAVTSGVLTDRLLHAHYVAAYPGVYVPRGIELSATMRARAAWLWSRRKGVLAGLSAATMLGTKWVEPANPAELIHRNRRSPDMLNVHSDMLLPAETTLVDGIAVTTAARTAFDIGRRTPVTQGVQRIDALMNATRVPLTDIERVIIAHPGVRGLDTLRRTLRLVDGGAESPYETLTRLMLVEAGLPRPQTQLPVLDEYGFAVAYLDMGWREYRVGVEYDGAQHWTDSRQRRRDIERFRDIEALGWSVVRVTSDMLRTPAAVIARVRATLAACNGPSTVRKLTA